MANAESELNMGYQVLARKYRPHTFAEVVGQVAVLRSLMQALDQQRVHHAYLFTGTRGVGKTTLARILAKCMNCETGVSATPCGVCATCLEIDAGKYPDLIEVDAASRSKVEETRDLLDNVIYAPVRGHYKIYLIDEVHMLSGHSFNALLKTLEEPPEHVKFLLATTDPQRLPITVVSRCLQLQLTPLTPELIAGQLTHIVAKENASAEPLALTEIAQAANGSMRDALSLLDQLLAYASGTLTSADVRTLLGIPLPEQVFQILRALAARDAMEMVTQIGQLAQQIPDLTTVLVALIDSLQQIAFAQIVPTSITPAHAYYQHITHLAAAWTPEDVQLFYEIALNGRRDLPYAATPRSGLEMILLRMLAFYPDTKKVIAPTTAITKPEIVSTPSRPSSKIEKPEVISEPSTIIKTKAVETENWAVIVEGLSLTEMTRAFALHCVLVAKDENSVKLAVAPQYAALLGKLQEQRLQQALNDYWGRDAKNPIKLQIVVQAIAEETPAQQRDALHAERHQQAVETLHADKQVQAIMDTFAATVIPDSVAHKQ